MEKRIGNVSSAPLPVWGERRQGLVFRPRGFSPGWLLAVEALRESGGFLPRGSWRKRKDEGVEHGFEFGLILNISIKNMSKCIHLHINLVLWTRINIFMLRWREACNIFFNF